MNNVFAVSGYGGPENFCAGQPVIGASVAGQAAWEWDPLRGGGWHRRLRSPFRTVAPAFV